MILIDSHCHFYDEAFDSDLHEAMESALRKNVREILLPNIDLSSMERLGKLMHQYPNQCKAMMGLHPCSIKESWEEDLAIILSELDSKSLLAEGQEYIAVGEIGIDLYWDKSSLEIQKLAFKEQLRWAKERNLPVAIHIREAFDEVFECIESEKTDALYGVFHCFTGSVQQAERAISLGFKLGLGGVLTFKNAGLDKVIDQIDISNLILETDAPYLAPQPFRGKRNEPAYVSLVAEKLADIKNISLEEVALITSRNCRELFKL